jgi:hypothetical protein
LRIAHAYSNTNIHPDIHGYSYIHGHDYSYGHGNSHRYCAADAYGYSHFHTYPDGHSDSYADRDGNVNLHAVLHVHHFHRRHDHSRDYRHRQPW